MFNVLNLFNWTTWLMITLCIIFVFWVIWGGKQEYEFIGVQPLSTPKLFPSTVNSYPAQGAVSTVSTTRELSNKGEDIVADALEDILNSPVRRNIRPNFLRNPETGKSLQLMGKVLE